MLYLSLSLNLKCSIGGVKISMSSEVETTSKFKQLYQSRRGIALVVTAGFQEKERRKQSHPKETI